MENKNGRPRKIQSPFIGIFRELIVGEKQYEIANRVGVTRQNVGKWLSGETTPDIINLCKIADAYNVSTDYLLGRTSTKAAEINEQERAYCTQVPKKAGTVLSQRLRNLLSENGKTYANLADYIKEITGETITRQAIGQWCNGNSSPKKKLLPLVAEFFGVTTDYLLGCTDKNPLATTQTTDFSLDTYLRSLVVVLTDVSTDFAKTFDYQTGEITIHNPQIIKFLKQCRDLLDSYRNGLLTKEMYESCVECAIREVTKEGDNNDVE